MKYSVIIGFILTFIVISGCGKSKQELIIGEWEIKSPKTPNLISDLKLHPDHTGILIRPHALIDIKEIPVRWTVDGDKLILEYQHNDNKEISGDTVQILYVNLKGMRIKKGGKEDVLVRIK
jgi:hypothetical protein